MDQWGDGLEEDRLVYLVDLFPGPGWDPVWARG